MWQVFPRKIRYGVVVAFPCILFVLFSLVLEWGILRSISSTITAVTLISLLFGKYLWRHIYIDFISKRFCPDLNGSWNAKIYSSYEGGTMVTVPMTINADLFSVRMEGVTDFGHTTVRSCHIFKDNNGRVNLEYIFEVKNDSARKGDTQYYEGAARLTLYDNEKEVWKGLYWTNRCWNEYKNTAGEIELIRCSEGGD